MSDMSDLSAPDIPPLSPGSSVSTRLQDEYDELLKFAVVVPNYDPQKLPSTLTDTRESFLQQTLQKGFGSYSLQRGPGSQSNSQREPTIGQELTNGIREPDDDELSEATDVTPINGKLSSRCSLPDFGGQSPIRSQQESGRNTHENSNNSHNPMARGPSQNQSQSHIEIGEYERVYTATVDPDVSKIETLMDQWCLDLKRNILPESHIEMGEYERVYTATVDPDVSKIETLMDQWCLDLKRNILAEFSQSKIRIVEQGRQQLLKEQEKHASDKMKLLDEMDRLKELLATYEKSIERKDQVISNLTNALQKQRDKNEMTKRFCEWKIRHNDHKRELFCTSLAKQYYERKLSQKVWDGWHGVIESKWKQRIEKACQSKAQEVCVQLTNDYEARLAQAKADLDAAQVEMSKLHAERERYEEMMKKAFMRGVCALNLEAKADLDAAQVEMSKLHAERERYEEMMKKAFMRGVCALNLEAMSIFQHGEEKENRGDPTTNGRVPDEFSDNMKSSLPDKDYSLGKSLPGETPRTGPQSNIIQDRIVTSQGSRPVTQSTSLQSKPQQSKGRPSSSKVLTAKVTSKVDSGKSKSQFTGPLAPPMSSVVVERHQPVTKQTMSHAIAGKYARPGSGVRGDRSGAITNKTIAGQGTISTNIQTVKHVE